MQITKLKIFGFKSFAQRTEINFPTKGLTAVVGPNGCGKSNITDAIRWVLGEQKAAALRMGKMQDVIFSGTEERAAMSLAEVSIVIDNSDGTLASEYSEVIVTRRVHRDGSGEYLINNQECRLRDVHALLFDSGLGSSTYSQMNSDMIKAVLSEKADDRRILFEEAAGVSKYKQQRKETRRQLERVQMDMQRVEDNLRSTRRSVHQYETQAEKVNQYKSLTKRLRELDLSVSLDKYEDFIQAQGTLDQSAKRMNHEIEANKTRVMELQTKIDEKKLAISEDENAYRDLEREVSNATLAMKDLNNKIEHLRYSLNTITEAKEKDQEEIDRSEEKIRNLTEEQTKLEREIEELGSDDDAAALNALLERERETLQVLRDDVDELRDQIRELSNQRISANNRVNDLKNRFQRVDAETAMLQGNMERWKSDVENLNHQKGEAEASIQHIQNEMDQVNQEIENLEEQKSIRGERLEGENLDFDEAQKTLAQLKTEEARLNSRIDVLQSVAAQESDASKWLKENKANLVNGLLSERIEADPEYASLVELALGDILDAVVLSDESALKEIVDSIQSENLGKAVMVIGSNGAQPCSVTVDHPGVKGSLERYVKADESLSLFLNGILSRYFVVDTLDTALELAKRFRSEDLCFVAPGAIVRSSGLVSSGAAVSGALSRKNEIQEASEALESVQQEISEKETSLENLKEVMEEDKTLFESLVEDIREKQDSLRSAGASIQIHKNTVEACDKRLSQIESEMAAAEEKISKANESKNSDAELSEAMAAAERVESEYERVVDQQTEKEQLFRDKDEEVRELERNAQNKNAILAQNASRLKNIAEQIEFHQHTVVARKTDMAKDEEDAIRFNEKLLELSNQAEADDSSLRDLELRRDIARERYEVVAGDIEEWRAEERHIHAEELDKMQELSEIGRRQEALQANIDRLTERLLNDWNVEIANPEGVERVEYEQPAADKEIRELRGKIKELGPINVNVMEDYEDEKRRLEEVEKQFDDLDRARASLDRTITKLDDIARTRYLETFERIQKNFQFVFSKLFLNGETKMSLVEKLDENGKPMDILDADIEINVRPTGKKMRGIKALSGGEHALTATALLFAIYMEKPSPYCVLDEVDGPLDDANVGRFMALLREFSKQTLFIVVTHNKRTMAEADMLYGVTQEIKGISRIASVQLADATKFAI